MKVRKLHSWDVSPGEAVKLQEELGAMVSRVCFLNNIHAVAGVDVRTPVYAQGEATAAVVVMTYPGLEEIEVSRENGAVTFPYVPGLLSFREIPLLVEAFQKLKNIPDLVLVDGQGIAHPRRMGIATHLGILLELPTIGCAKSRLIGEYTEPGPEAGCHTNLMDNNEIIGAVVRTRTNTKPVYVSIGHKIDLTSAIQLTLSCCAGYRIPEPTRRAHLWANKKIEPVGVLN